MVDSTKNIHLGNFEIKTDENENKFINAILNGNYTCGKNIYDDVWNMFTQMAKRRQERKTETNFFKKILKISTFLNAYNEANKHEDTNEQKVKNMFEYKKYAEDSVMYGITTKYSDRGKKAIDKIAEEAFERKIVNGVYPPGTKSCGRGKNKERPRIVGRNSRRQQNYGWTNLGDLYALGS